MSGVTMDNHCEAEWGLIGEAEEGGLGWAGWEVLSLRESGVDFAC